MKPFLNIFASLRLTVFLLACSMLLVFFGTLDQVEYGVYEVQKRYFESLVVLWQYPKQWVGGAHLPWLMLPMPGGYLLGALLLINLVCAHFKYFVPSRKKLGIVLLHAGVVLLVISGFTTSAFQKESQMWIKEGEVSRYTEDFRDNELVIINKSNERYDDVYVIGQEHFKDGSSIKVEGTPFKLNIMEFYPNAELGMESKNPEFGKSKATQGAGKKMGLLAVPRPVEYHMDAVNTASAYVRVTAGAEDLGIWLVSNVIDERFPPQTIDYQGNTYEVALRFKRTYLPFDLKLLDFTYDKYPGTDIPRNFSSKVEVLEPGESDGREVLIYMNHPLRHMGYTLYQASFGQGETASMLQVVTNPSRLLPYIAVGLVGLGLLVHFVMHLVTYLRTRAFK